MKLPKKIDHISSEYSQIEWFRAIITGTPFIGSSIDTFIGTRGQRIQQKRVEIFIEELKKMLSEIQEEKLDKNYLESEEFYDLFRIALDSTSKTRDEEKIRLYSQILAGALQKPAQSSSAENYIRVITELSEMDIKIAQNVFEMQKELPNEFPDPNEDGSNNELNFVKNHGWEKLPELTKLSWNELSFHLHNLERAGLLSEITGTYIGYLGGVYRITTTFKKIMSLIKNVE